MLSSTTGGTGPTSRPSATARQWLPYRTLAARALGDVYRTLGLDGDALADTQTLLGSLPAWPLWSDVADGLPALASRLRLGLLSNVDDELVASTRAARLVDPDLALTSQRLRAYKPGRRIYDEARRLLGPMVHIASSARDVRGAIEAGVIVIRLRRPGHELDPEGPTPEFEVDDISELAALLERMSPG